MEVKFRDKIMMSSDFQIELKSFQLTHCLGDKYNYVRYPDS